MARPDPEVVAMLTSGLTASIALEKVTLHTHTSNFVFFLDGPFVITFAIIASCSFHYKYLVFIH